MLRYINAYTVLMMSYYASLHNNVLGVTIHSNMMYIYIAVLLMDRDRTVKILQ